jgi:hypothetical protein
MISAALFFVVIGSVAVALTAIAFYGVSRP